MTISGIALAVLLAGSTGGSQAVFNIQAPQPSRGGTTFHDSNQMRFVRELTQLREDALRRQAANGGVLAEADRAELQARLDKVRARHLARR